MRHKRIKPYLIIAILIAVTILSALSVGISFASERFDYNIAAEEKETLLNQVNYLENTTRTTDIGFFNNGQEKREQRTLLLMDFYDKYAYIYMEFDLGGYALYDRLGEFIYERSEQGDGPYCDYYGNDKLYYGGAQCYYVKINGIYINTVINEIIDIDTAKSYTNSLNAVRETNIKERIKEQRELSAINNFPSTYANIGDILHINLGYSKGSSFAGQLYFNLMGYCDWEYQKQKAGNSKKFYPTMDFSDYDTLSPQDVLFAYNEHGSCSIVALAMTMQYYDRLKLLYPNDGYRKMLPNDANNFRKKYDLERSYFDKNGNKIPNSDKNAYRGEYLHQELLCIMFPDTIVTNEKKSVFGIHLDKMIPHVKTYFNKYGLQQTTLTKRTNDSGALGHIKKGNPVMLSFYGNADLDNSDPSINRVISHSVVSFGVNVKIGLFGIMTPIEYLCNFGWINKNSLGVYVNKSLIYANMNLNVF